MLPYRDSRFTMIALAVFFAIALGYTLFEARGVVLGPTIELPAGTATVTDPYVIIGGRASRISSLSMNGKQIQVTEDGRFAEPYLLAPGYNRVMLDAKDQYGRSQQRAVEIMYIPATMPTTTGVGATSTLIAPSTAPIAPQ